MRITQEQYNDLIRRVACPQIAPIIPLPGAANRSKYHNVITECDNIKFQSKKEAAYYRGLCCRVHAGEVRYFLRQVPFDLVGGLKYRIDFMEVWADGSIHWIDVKGFRTQTYRLKRRMVEASYPVKIEEA